MSASGRRTSPTTASAPNPSDPSPPALRRATAWATDDGASATGAAPLRACANRSSAIGSPARRVSPTARWRTPNASRLRQQVVGPRVHGESHHLQLVGMAARHVERLRADGTRGAQHNDAPHARLLHIHTVSTSRPYVDEDSRSSITFRQTSGTGYGMQPKPSSKMAEVTATKNSESQRSSSPP